MRPLVIILLVLTLPAALVSAQRTNRGGARRLTTEARCASDLGAGVKSRRQFCDVIIAASGAESVAMSIPAHTGAATLMFDLHNRFTVQIGVDPGQAFMRHVALASVVRPTGQVVSRAAVTREFRTVNDLFDRIAGTGAGGFKVVAPGQPEAVTITIPAGISSIGIVGTRLEVTSRAGRALHETPGRAIAIVSNLRIEYSAR